MAERWPDDPACLGLGDFFFPEVSSERKAAQAAELCFTCPVRQQCLDRALDVQPSHGVWAGFTAHELADHRRAGTTPTI